MNYVDKRIIFLLIAVMLVGCEYKGIDPIKAFEATKLSQATSSETDANIYSASGISTQAVKIEIKTGETATFSFETNPTAGNATVYVLDSSGNYLYNNGSNGLLKDSVYVDTPGEYLLFIILDNFTGSCKYNYSIN